MSSSLLSLSRQHAARVGLNLFGLVDAARFDVCQPRELRTKTLWPACGTVMVLGHGGNTFSPQLRREGCAVDANLAAAELGRCASLAVKGVSQALGEAAVPNRVVEASHGVRLNFGRLAEAAGFGIVSPVSGMLLHPEFGPWVSLRAALLFEGHPFGPIADASITDTFHPCCACAKPCVTACPATVHDGHGRQDLERCTDHRSHGGCATSCSSKAACPIGATHRGASTDLAQTGIACRPGPRGWSAVLRLLPRFWSR